MTASQSTTVAEAPARELTFAPVNPLECSEEIKALFLAHERPEFPAFFDRTYPDAVRDGAVSCVGRDETGRLCAHIAHFPRPFRLGDRVVRASLLANLMVAKEHRTLWPALKLVRSLVNDCKLSASIDFLYGDPNEAALSILRAIGFRPAGALRRFVAPIADGNAVVDLGIGMYQLLQTFRGPTMELEVRSHRAIDLAAGPNIGDPAEPGSLSPAPRPEVYRHRLPGYPGAGDRWYTFHRRKGSDPVAAALVREPDGDGVGLAVVGALQGTSPSLLTPVLLGLMRTLRRAGRGIERLELSVMGESRVAAAVQRAGFVQREEQIPVVAMPLTARGTEALESGAEWRLLPVDLDR
ncbi:MAG TPA: hypothetical protein VGQ18_10970 [Gemmatimonadales bacterium]|nr:hypothetical protein [Gemmatimonadales bacterium]